MAMSNGAEADRPSLDIDALLNGSEDCERIGNDDDDKSEPEPDFELLMKDTPSASIKQAREARNKRIEEATMPESKIDSHGDPDDAKKSVNSTGKFKRPMRGCPPGLNIFSGKFLCNFSASDLKLETHFGYNNRIRLQMLGVSQDEIEQIMSNMNVFLAHLSPTFKTALVKNQQDFAKICDYLFYYCSSCTNELSNDLAKQALCELLKSYPHYVWKLNLDHVLTALANLGADMKIFANEEMIKDMLANRIQILEETSKRSGNGPYQFKLPKVKRSLARFIATKDADYFDVDRICLLRMFVALVSDIVACCDAERSIFKPDSDDWTAQLILIYIFQYVSMDKALVFDSYVSTSIKQLYNAQFESFSEFQWLGDKQFKSADKPCDVGSLNDSKSNACNDISKVLADPLNTNEAKMAARTWTKEDLPPKEHMDYLDHHHNMVRRLLLMPLTNRAYQVRKNAAFLQLQRLLNSEIIRGFAQTDVDDFCKFILDNANSRSMFRVLVKDEHYMALSLVKLVDMIVGGEPSDFQLHMLVSVAEVSNFLTDCTKRIHCETTKSDGSRVREVIEQTVSKWKLMGQMAKWEWIEQRLELERQRIEASNSTL